jgi:hypothetical protein
VITVDQYAASVVEKYQVIPDPGSPPHCAADAIIPVLKQWGNQYLAGITLSGAYAQHTALSLTSQVDILISLNPVPNMEMKGVFWNLFEYLTNQDFQPRTRNVSIELMSHGLHVDVIPSFRNKGNAGQMLFDKKTGKEISTDVGQHVHLIANSGRTQEICALKIWRERSSLEFPSLYLALSVLRALDGERFGQLADNFVTVLRFLAGRFLKTVVRDPANPDNVVSDDLAAAEKKAIAAAAHHALNDENWKKMIW